MLTWDTTTILTVKRFNFQTKVFQPNTCWKIVASQQCWWWCSTAVTSDNIHNQSARPLWRTPAYIISQLSSRHLQIGCEVNLFQVKSNRNSARWFWKHASDFFCATKGIKSLCFFRFLFVCFSVSFDLEALHHTNQLSIGALLPSYISNFSGSHLK